MINRENIQTFRNYGFVLTGVHKSKDPDKDKKPKSFKGPDGQYHWSNKIGYEWTDQELLEENRIGAFHADSKIFDVDFDDKSFTAHKFMDMLPDTLTIGKKVNGKIIATHKIYRSPDNVKLKPYSFPSKAKKGQKILELLTNTQTIIAGVDRVIINNVKPLSVDPESIKQHLKMIVAFSELNKHWPDDASGQRNDAFFRLGGALASQTDIPMDLRIKYVEKLCELTGDTEINNRLSCIERQQQKYEEGENQYGIKELSGYLDVNLKGFDEIKRAEEAEVEEEENQYATGLEFLNGHEFTIKDFPKPKALLYPIVCYQQIRQIFAPAGTGKSLYVLHEGGAVASGYDFLHYKNEKKTKTPVLIVEGEMDSSQIQSRLNKLAEAYEMEGRTLNLNYIFFATLAIQKDMYFESLTREVGRKNVEITAKKIEEITGKKPVIYLDNITALTIMQEKEGADWVELMHWLSRLRNMGYHITFLHHPTKTGETASGSNIKERSIDIDMKLTTPDEKTLIEEYEDNHTQITIEFLKWREHMNTFHSKKRIAIINRTTGRWIVEPMLNKTQRSISALIREGKTADEIVAAGKKSKGEGMSRANVYKVIKILKAEGVIKDEVS